MTPYEFKATLRPATQAQLDRLDRAHWRYISLIGLVSDVVAAGVVAADQKTYPQFIKRFEGRPVFNDDDCMRFIAAVTGLAPSLCAAWRDQDFYQLHGETTQAMAARQNSHG